MKQVLEMFFIKEDSKTAKITVANARDDISGTEVKEAMDTILEENIFIPGGSELVEAHRAKIVRTEEEELQIG